MNNKRGLSSSGALLFFIALSPWIPSNRKSKRGGESVTVERELRRLFSLAKSGANAAGGVVDYAAESAQQFSGRTVFLSAASCAHRGLSVEESR